MAEENGARYRLSMFTPTGERYEALVASIELQDGLRLNFTTVDGRHHSTTLPYILEKDFAEGSVFPFHKLESGGTWTR